MVALTLVSNSSGDRMERAFHPPTDTNPKQAEPRMAQTGEPLGAAAKNKGSRAAETSEISKVFFLPIFSISRKLMKSPGRSAALVIKFPK
jgi:hypothetical protein